MRVRVFRHWSVLGGALFILVVAALGLVSHRKTPPVKSLQSQVITIPITIPVNYASSPSTISLSAKPSQAVVAVKGLNSLSSADSLGIDINQLLALTNAQRSQVGAGTLSLNSKLTGAAQNKCQDMVAKNYWSHNAPDGTTPWSFDISQGYSYKKLAENLATSFSDAQSVMTAWMASAEHRTNLLDPAYSDVGFGVCKSNAYIGANNLPAIIVVEHLGEPL